MSHKIKIAFISMIFISLVACKSDKKTTVNEPAPSLQDSEKTVLAGSTTTDVAQSDSLNQLAETQNSVVEEAQKPVEEKVEPRRKTTFNPPHIAVLEQDYNKPAAKVAKKPAVEKPAVEKPAVKATKVQTEKATIQKPVVQKTTVSKPVSQNSTVEAPSAPVSTPQSTRKQEIVPVKKTSAPAVASTPSASNAPMTEVVFRRNFYSFGDIVQGDTVRFNFDFTNIGQSPLVITDAKGSCSCTLPEYPINPILPGESGKITGMYVSTGKHGPQNASVTISSNTSPSSHQLLLDGKVLLPSESDSEASTDKN